ncbi:MAG: hypothetical protein RLZZ116_1689 [Planctomycetota bacterium]|jgi:antitoxin VapB
MHSTRIFMNGASQAVRLPAEYRFENPEVCITRIGSMVIIYPKDGAWDLLQSAIGSVTDDFRRPEQGTPEHDLADLDPTPAAIRARVYRTKKSTSRSLKSTAAKTPAKRQRKSA